MGHWAIGNRQWALGAGLWAVVCTYRQASAWRAGSIDLVDCDAMAPSDDLPLGHYARLVTKGLRSRLDRLDSKTVEVWTEPVDRAELGTRLSRHVQDVVARALAGLPTELRESKSVEIANELVELLARAGEELREQAILQPPHELLRLAPVNALGASARAAAQPIIPLSESDLLVNARGEPALASALNRELPSADSIDLLCAFVRWHGLRVLQEPLLAHLRSGRRLRVITTVYTGSTERKALDWLVANGAQVKVSYDTQSTRLHAKAWLFRRETGFSTAYIGSSNLSKSALIDGVEWNVRLAQATSPDILSKFDATFETYWASPEYEAYDPERDRDRFDKAVSASPATGMDDSFTSFLEVTPWPHQTEMLEKLAAERDRHHYYRNLVVAATGTGKTIVAALDYKRLRTQLPSARLLFVAHREQLLSQSLSAFRHVLRDGSFGQRFVDGRRPDEWSHVFASVQSLSQVPLDALKPEAFDVVIVDEFHRAGAPTYARLLTHLRPRVLLGLTATPERSDGEDILRYFDGRIAVELRLWDALERGLLTPFQYFGLHDNTDLRSVRWSRQGYDLAELADLYTGDDARVRLVLQELYNKHRSPDTMRALGFCVSIEHARFMARRFTEAGLPSEAVFSETSTDARHEAIARLRGGRLRVLFAVDLFNEGVDIPEVDTLLLLRPTESALVFIQQLGRGLRRHESKDCVTVLDFIGQSHRSFRFDLRYRAMTGGSRQDVERQINGGFPFLPAGCSVQLDRVASRIVLDSLRSAVPSNRPAMVRELRALASSERFRNTPITLREFLSESGLELTDVYARGCWSGLKRDSGLTVPQTGPSEDTIAKGLGRLLHIDDPIRLNGYRRLAKGVPGSRPTDARLLAGLIATIWPGSEGPASVQAFSELLTEHPALTGELCELVDLLEEEATHLTVPLNQELGWEHDVPLSVHARHSKAEILSAFGRIGPGRFFQHREGTYADDGTHSDLFFVTLEKSERDYSPTTMYRDFAISPELFHWESQSMTSERSATGQRYINQAERGRRILLFVRARAKDRSRRTVPYTFLGPVDYVSHKQERPIQFVWRLRRPMPADFFRDARVAAG